MTFSFHLLGEGGIWDSPSYKKSLGVIIENAFFNVRLLCGKRMNKVIAANASLRSRRVGMEGFFIKENIVVCRVAPFLENEKHLKEGRESWKCIVGVLKRRLLSCWSGVSIFG